MTDNLTSTVKASHEMLRERINETAQCAFPRRSRDQHARADAVLIATCRHVAAVSTVLVGEVARQGNHQQAQRLSHECHSLQLSLLRAKGRLYGAAQLAALPWPTVWNQVVDHFETLMSLERDAVSELAAKSSPEALELLAERLCRVDQHAPTRPHPFIPQHGFGGWLASAVFSRVDRFWDALQGRCAPPPAPFVRN